MPELPEVETVKETLKRNVLNDVIVSVTVNYKNILANIKPEEFEKVMKNKHIVDIDRRGKWLIFDFGKDVLLSHLRMEGRYYLKTKEDEISKHEHIIFHLKSGKELRYHDTRKFGRMYFYPKDKMFKEEPLLSLGLEPFDKNLNSTYLKDKCKDKKLPIKTTLLDQSIIVGIGNIYADEVLFKSCINPNKKACDITLKEWDNIINSTKEILKKAIKLGGTTIKSYESSEGVHGKFQNELLVHGQDVCPSCKSKIEKIRIGGRGTYFCQKCQK